ncbi:probable arginine--tRNA ligase, cytoplasmic [Phlebotomus argentipes]|uniref:probable arginine--tRNA ligase, cytoplasmic n=1 Tax=Phlebotomus argentipes TaxID=94469 RepID=UPI0028936B7C|nr:probable arginine--tRNA ligase, cytoplasmic [Phlebotomus argentipes]
MGDKSDELFSNLNKMNDIAMELENEIRCMSDVGASSEDEELTRLVAENQSLKHRLHILNKAIGEYKPTDEVKVNSQFSILNHLTDIFRDALSRLYDGEFVQNVTVAATNNAKFGDYQFNSAMTIAKIFKDRGVGRNPREIAMEVMAQVQKSEIVERFEVAGGGFVNIFLKRECVAGLIKSILVDGIQAPCAARKRVVVDFSSPNVAKEMHVGHLRSTIIGDSICRLLEFFNHDVLRINHVGDWGTQFGMLIAHLQDKFPDYTKTTPSISDLQAFYKESKARFDSEEAFKARAYACVVKLQAGDKEIIKAWQDICNVSRKEFQVIYDRLGVKLIERGESFYQQRMVKIVEELQKGGFLEDDEGRKIMWSSESSGENRGIPLTIVKSDGGYTYDTSDMAAIKQRFVEEKADWLIYVTDAGQFTHFQTIFACSERTGLINKELHRVDHVGFGVVLGEDGKKFKTRSGDTIKLVMLLDEGLQRSLAKLREKGRHEQLTADELKIAQEAVTYGCIKYADLSHNRVSDYVFSFDQMLDDKGNTAVYLLYAYTRIKSIARNCAEHFKLTDDLVRSTAIALDHEKEWNLAKVLLKFSDVLLKLSKDFLLNHLCDFTYEIATSFADFYDKCYCIEKNKAGEIVKINHSRVLLAEATARMLEKCFHILGINLVEKM